MVIIVVVIVVVWCCEERGKDDLVSNDVVVYSQIVNEVCSARSQQKGEYIPRKMQMLT